MQKKVTRMADFEQKGNDRTNNGSQDRRLEFLTNISYEMRTPLNAIMDLTSVILSDRIPLPTKERVRQIDRAAHYLSSIVDDTLDISLFESGRLHLDSEPFSFDELIGSVEELIAPECEKNGINFVCRVSPGVKGSYIGDVRRIRQVLLNLLRHSLLLTQRNGEIVLDARETRGGKNTAELTFAVIDNGLGIDAKYLPHLFEPLPPTDEEEASDGYGLGLAVAADLVELMGGSIHADSKRGVGTRFTVEISVGMTEDDAMEAIVPEGPSSLDIDFQNRRILLVEDNPINAEVTQDLLELHGFLVEHAANGEEAVKLFEDSRPGTYDAILMDIRMPVMSGLEAVGEIRSFDRPDSDNVPIIAMSANAFAEDVQRSLDAGMNVHLSKPVDPEKLFSVLADLLIQ